jgi:hypothetical protein
VAFTNATNKKAPQDLRGFLVYLMDHVNQVTLSGGEGGIRTRGGD